MICPKCGKPADVHNVYDRDTDLPRRRYVCAECQPPVVINTEEVLVSFGQLQRRPKPRLVSLPELSRR